MKDFRYRFVGSRTSRYRLVKCLRTFRLAVLGAFFLQIFPVTLLVAMPPQGGLAGDHARWVSAYAEKHPYSIQQSQKDVFSGLFFSCRRSLRYQESGSHATVSENVQKASLQDRRSFEFHAVVFYYPLALLIPPPKAEPDHLS